LLDGWLERHTQGSGLLRGRQAAPWAPWRITLDEDTRQRLAGNDVPEGWVSLVRSVKALPCCRNVPIAAAVSNGWSWPATERGGANAVLQGDKLTIP